MDDNSGFHKIMFECYRGSRAQGLATPGSDEDIYRILIPSENHIIGLLSMEGSQKIVDGRDVRRITLKEFLRQIVNGRSTELEVLWVPKDCIQFDSQESNELIANRRKLLSQKLFDGLIGCFYSQRARGAHNLNQKMVAHSIRAVYQAYVLKTTMELPIRIEDEELRATLLALKLGTKSMEDAIKLSVHWFNKYEAAEQVAELPKVPDFKFANDFLKKVYRNAVNGQV